MGEKRKACKQKGMDEGEKAIKAVCSRPTCTASLALITLRSGFCSILRPDRPRVVGVLRGGECEGVRGVFEARRAQLESTLPGHAQN